MNDINADTYARFVIANGILNVGYQWLHSYYGNHGFFARFDYLPNIHEQYIANELSPQIPTLVPLEFWGVSNQQNQIREKMGEF